MHWPPCTTLGMGRQVTCVGQNWLGLCSVLFNSEVAFPTQMELHADFPPGSSCLHCSNPCLFLTMNWLHFCTTVCSFIALLIHIFALSSVIWIYSERDFFGLWEFCIKRTCASYGFRAPGKLTSGLFRDLWFISLRIHVRESLRVHVWPEGGDPARTTEHACSKACDQEAKSGSAPERPHLTQRCKPFTFSCLKIPAAYIREGEGKERKEREAEAMQRVIHPQILLGFSQSNPRMDLGWSNTLSLTWRYHKSAVRHSYATPL